MIADQSFLASHSVSELVVIGAIAVVLGGAVVWASFKLPKAVLLGIVLAAAILQGFEPVGYISIALLIPIAMGPAIIAASSREHWGTWPRVILAIVVWQVISVLWAVNLGSLAHAVLSSVSLLMCYLLARQVVGDEKGLYRALAIASPFVLLQVALTIAFRFFPMIEAGYYASSIANFFSEPNVNQMMLGLPQNVSDTTKSGGFLLNGNIASLLLALIACAYLYSFARARRRLLAAVSVAALLGCLATGSKTALVLMIVLPVLAVVWAVLFKHRRTALALLAGLVVVLGALVIFLASTGSSLFTTSVTTFGVRGRIWALAGHGFSQHPILGLGYGGWADYLVDNASAVFDPGRGLQDFPTHNFIIQAWADGGLVLALLVTVASVFPIVSALHGLRTQKYALVSFNFAKRLVLVVAVVWIFAHSFADTTGFFGENHTLPIFALLVAFVAFESSHDARNRASDRAAQDGGHPARRMSWRRRPSKASR